MKCDPAVFLILVNQIFNENEKKTLKKQVERQKTELDFSFVGHREENCKVKGE